MDKERLIEPGTKPAQLELIIRIDPASQQARVEFPPDELTCYRMLFQAALIIGKKFDAQRRIALAQKGDLGSLPPPPGDNGVPRA